MNTNNYDQLQTPNQLIMLKVHGHLSRAYHAVIDPIAKLFDSNTFIFVKK